MEGRRLTGLLMPSIGDVLFLSVFLMALHQGVRLLGDGDTGWHIVTGEGILQSLKAPVMDQFSHTVPGTPWTAHEWLAAVVFAAVHGLMGLNGVVLLTAAVISGTFLLLYRYMLHRGVSPVIAGFMAVIAVLASANHWLARPHIFSFTLTLAFVVILDMYQREGINRLKYLPALMALWVNLHAGFTMGLMLVFIYIGGNLLIFLLHKDGRAKAGQKLKGLGIAGLATVVSTFVNPHGPKILYFPFHLVGRQYIVDNILEWQSSNFHTAKAFEFMLLLFIAIFVLSRKKPDIFEGCMALMIVHMALFAARFFPLAAIILTPMAATRAGGVLEGAAGWFGGSAVVARLKARLQAMSVRVAAQERRFRAHLWVYAALAVCLAAGINGGMLAGRQVMAYEYDKKNFPVDALEFAVKSGIKGNMFNNDGWGGYVIYKAYPRYKVFIDGRVDMYGVPLLKEYIKVARARLGCEDVLDKYKVDWVLYNPDSAICRLLEATGRWRPVYKDKTAEILVRGLPGGR